MRSGGGAGSWADEELGSGLLEAGRSGAALDPAADAEAEADAMADAEAGAMADAEAGAMADTVPDASPAGCANAALTLSAPHTSAAAVATASRRWGHRRERVMIKVVTGVSWGAAAPF